MTDSKAAKTEGAILGMAIGEAMGAGTAFLRAGHIQQVLGEVTGYVDLIDKMPERPGKWRLKGLHGVSTTQALALCDVLAVENEWNLRSWADLQVRLADEGPAGEATGSWRAADHHFRHALELLRREKNLLSCGQAAADARAAARVAPLSAWFQDDEEALAAAVAEASLATHHDPRAIAGAIFVARLIGQFMGGATAPEVGARLADLADWLKQQELVITSRYRDCFTYEMREKRVHDMSGAVRLLPSLLREGNAKLAETSVLEYANRCEPGDQVSQVQVSFSPAVIPWVVYQALTAADFALGLLGIVNMGGDAATAGAIAGSILGARFGAQGIPRDWRNGLVSERLVSQRARALSAREVDWSDWDDLVDSERELTEKELAAIEQGKLRHRKEIGQREEKQAERRANSPS